MELLPDGWSLESLGAAVPPPARPPLRRVRDLAAGVWPRPLADWRLGRVTRDPLTFTEKILWRMAYDRRPILTRIADKVAVRDYVADRVGAALLPEVLGIHERADEIDWLGLPREYVCKASHGSGAVVLVWDGAPAGSMLPVNASRVEWDRFAVRPDVSVRPRLAQLVDRWMRLRFEYSPGHLPEWAYRDVPPRVILEELLLDESGGVPSDYKFYVFDGVVRIVQVDTARFARHRREFFRPDGTPIPMFGNLDAPDEATPLPARLPEMLGLASELGAGLDFVRVDLYDLPGRIVFGELTGSPGGGAIPLRPRSYDYEFGSCWTLPRLDDPTVG